MRARHQSRLVCSTSVFLVPQTYVNGARIIRWDINAQNGVVHIIDTFLAQPLVPGNGLPLPVSAMGFILDKGDEIQEKRNERKLQTT